ncbi:DUF7344 domain-containing protein [Haloarcula sediminis]|uniref:DUF7344 domain-containing protein n=1 Tax=Haloarcula sediminis TaxID=3111777 RepID=UPI002D769AA5|nr:hypothetical protein [Haloarcula sp. CK38]
MNARFSATDGATSQETLADLLSDPHCKHLLVLLRESDGPTGVEDVSRDIVGRMTGVAAGQVPANVERRVQIWLHHGLLPTLDEQGIVAFDPEQRTVALTDESVAPAAGSQPRRREGDPEPD